MKSKTNRKQPFQFFFFFCVCALRGCRNKKSSLSALLQLCLAGEIELTRMFCCHHDGNIRRRSIPHGVTVKQQPGAVPPPAPNPLSVSPLASSLAGRSRSSGRRVDKLFSTWSPMIRELLEAAALLAYSTAVSSWRSTIKTSREGRLKYRAVS